MRLPRWRLQSQAITCACLAVASCGTVEPVQAGIMNTPGLNNVRFWESTGPFVPYNFLPGSPEMTTKLGVGTLGPSAFDFTTAADEVLPFLRRRR